MLERLERGETVNGYRIVDVRVVKVEDDLEPTTLTEEEIRSLEQDDEDEGDSQ